MSCSNVLKCGEKNEAEESFPCISTTESVWVRIWKEEANKAIIENCGTDYLEKYQNVMYLTFSVISFMFRMVNCTIRGNDVWDYLKVSVGKSNEMTVRMGI